MGDIVAAVLVISVAVKEYHRPSGLVEVQSWKPEAGCWDSPSGKGCFLVHRGSFHVMCPAMRVLSRTKHLLLVLGFVRPSQKTPSQDNMPTRYHRLPCVIKRLQRAHLDR